LIAIQAGSSTKHFADLTTAEAAIHHRTMADPGQNPSPNQPIATP
jgi:hypothetical protein